MLKDSKRINYTFSSIAEKNFISVSSVVNIFDQYVDIKLDLLPKVLSVDKFYLSNTFANKFAYIFINWETGLIIDIYLSRKNINKSLDDLRIDVMKIKEKDSLDYYLLKHLNSLLSKRRSDIKKMNLNITKRLDLY